MNDLNILFTPQTIGKVRLKNRIAMAPMGIEYMTAPDGSLNRRVVDYYLERVRYGVGLIICSVFKVENQVEHLEECSPMIRETSLNYLGDLCDAAHSFGSRIFIQLTAGFGRVTPPNILRGPCVSASENPNFWDPSIICQELTIDEITQIVTAMGDTAELLALAGVDGIELHGHEGYLFDQFTSSLWNQRADSYGGSLEKRLRFPVECIQEIRGRVQDRLAVVYRFGLKHYLKDRVQGALPGEAFEEIGRDVAEGLDMARQLEQGGFDALHVDAGCYESHYWPHPPIYQQHGCMLDMAAKAKEVVRIPVIAVGRLDTPNAAARAVADGMADMVALGRGLLADPQWADKVQFGAVEDIRPCIGCYDGCLEAYSTFRSLSCAINPAVGRERAYRLEPAQNYLKVMVVGGGIAGMEAARVAALRGHRVSLYEQNETLGGLVRQAAVPEFKKDLRRLLAWYVRQVEQAGVNVLLNREVGADTFHTLSPDVTIIAAGASPIVPDLPGIGHDSVVTAVDLLKEKQQAGMRTVIIGGGLAGCEIAIWLAEQGKEVLIVEMLPELMASGAPVPMQVKMMTLNLLKKYDVQIMTGSTLQQITSDGTHVLHKDRSTSRIAADTNVLAIGMTPNTQLAEQIERQEQRVYRIGDCRDPRNIMNAVWDAYEIARWL